MAHGARIDRYAMHTVLGPDVGRASDRLGGPDVIVKRAKEGPARDALEREVRLAIDLEGHAAARAVHAVASHEDGSLTVVLEDVIGRPLDLVSPAPREAHRLAVELLRALLSLHDRGLVHGDLKPAHVLVDEDGAIRLLDLGLVTPLGAPARGGTHGFLAPELLLGAATSAQTELHAFGRTLVAASMRGLDARLDRLIDACVAIDARERPPSIEAALAMLDALPRHRSVSRDDPLASVLVEIDRALEADDGRTLTIALARGGGRTHLTRTAVHRSSARPARSLVAVGGGALVGGLVAAAPLFETPHTEDRERLVERTLSRAIDAGVRWLVDGGDDASPDLRADLVTAARASFALGRGLLVIVGVDDALHRALADVSPSLATLTVPQIDDAELHRALEGADVALDASGRAELLARTERRRGVVHRAIRRLARGDVSLEVAIERSVGIVAVAEPDPSVRRERARAARANDAPRAALVALDTDDDDEALRLSSWAHARTGAVAQAIVFLDRIPASHRSATDRAQRARWLERVGRLEEAFDEAAALLDHTDLPPETHTIAILAAATSAHRRGRLEDARAILERVPPTLDAIARCRLDTVASDVALARGDHAEARRLALQALARGEALGDRSLLALVEARLGAISGLGGDPGRALDHHERALAHAEAAGELSALPPYLGNVASAHHLLGHVDLAIATYERAAGLAERLGRSSSLATTLVNLAGLHQLLRADEEANALLDRAADVARGVGAELVVVQSMLIRAELARDRGATSLARREATRARDAFEAAGAARQALEASVLLAELDARDGRASDAIERGATEELESAGLDARAALVRAELAWRARRTSEACTLAEDAADRARRARQPEQELRASAFLARAHASLGTGAADVHASSFRRRLGDLAARTPPGLRERFVRRWTEAAGLDDVAHTTTRSARAAASHEGLGLAGHRLVSLVRRTLLEADEARLLEAALDEAITASGAERGFLLLARDGKRAEIAVARNLDRDTIKRPRFRMSRSVADRVLATNEPLVTASATEDPELAGSRSILDLGLRSIVCVPVRSPSGVVGALYLDHRFERGRFDTEVSEIAQAFADVVGLALENTRLHRANEARLHEAETLRAAPRNERAPTCSTPIAWPRCWRAGASIAPTHQEASSDRRRRSAQRSSSCARSPAPTSRSASRASPARARSSSRASPTTRARAARAPSSRSTAAPCPRHCSRVSCSVTCAVRSPARHAITKDFCGARTAARSFSTRSARCRPRCRCACCARYKSARSGRSAGAARSPSTCASSAPPTEVSPTRSSEGPFAVTSTSASRA